MKQLSVEVCGIEKGLQYQRRQDKSSVALKSFIRNKINQCTSLCLTVTSLYIVEGQNGCAVAVHDRQDNRVGRRTAQGSRTKHTKSMSAALCRSGQHCNERSIVIELNEKSSLRRYLSLCRASQSSSLFLIIMMMIPRLQLQSYTESPVQNNYSPESGDSSGGATEPHHNI